MWNSETEVNAFHDLWGIPAKCVDMCGNPYEVCGINVWNSSQICGIIVLIFVSGNVWGNHCVPFSNRLDIYLRQHLGGQQAANAVANS